jgi:hypothetical protein
VLFEPLDFIARLARWCRATRPPHRFPRHLSPERAPPPPRCARTATGTCGRRRDHAVATPCLDDLDAAPATSVRDRPQPVSSLRRTASRAGRDHRPAGDRSHPGTHRDPRSPRPATGATPTARAARCHRWCASSAPGADVAARPARQQRWPRGCQRTLLRPVSRRRTIRATWSAQT